MSPTASSRGLRVVPWAVLLVTLTVTLATVVWRDRAVSTERDAAVASADGHFRDVVTDHERQISDAQREIEIMLLGASTPGESALSPEMIANRLTRLGADNLPGIRGFALLDDTGVEIVTEIAPGLSADTLAFVDRIEWPADASQNRARVETVALTEGDLVVVGVGAAPSLVALFDGGEFVFGPGLHQGHNVQASLGESGSNGLTPMPEMGSSMDGEMDMAGTAGDIVDGHEHEDNVTHGHGSDARFSSMSTVDVFGDDWTLTVNSTNGFLETPTSREVLILGPLGLALSVVLFGLVHRLVRSRTAAELELRVNTERFNTGFERSPIGVVELDEEGIILKVNDAAAELLGLPMSQLVGQSLAGFVAEDARAEAARHLDGSRESPDGARTELRYVLDGGREVWVHLTSSAVNGPEAADHTLVQMVDVTEQHRVRDELERQALHDELTDLPNRALLSDRLDRALARGRRSGHKTAAIFIDLDHFKRVNDSLGHQAGDLMLVETARRLHQSARGSDTVARFGGDEFVVLCEDLDTVDEALALAERVRASMIPPFELDGRTHLVTVSVGVAVATGSDDADALLRDADLAMYHAKDSGRDQSVLFDREMRVTLVKRLDLEDELRGAIDSDELRVFYQPLCDLDTGQTLGFEALVRWEHPTRGLIAPDDFLPVADQLRLTTEIDAWVLKAATAQLRQWTDDVPGASRWSVSVNASAPNFADPDFAGRVRQTIEKSGLAAHRVTIELTENAVLANAGVANKIIDELRAFGVRIAIDDFGTGYSSFSQVASLSFDVLKIDRSLIGRLSDSTGGEVVRTVIQMAHSLGLTTVAEGVETADDLELLRSLGSDVAQGFFLGRPIPRESVIDQHAKAAAFPRK